MNDEKPVEPSFARRLARMAALALIGVALVLGVVAITAAFALSRNERSMIYFPARPVDRTPADLRLPFEDVWLDVEEGVRVHAWLIKAEGPTRATVLFSHGNAGNISSRLGRVKDLRNLGLDLLLYDYRGYGKSTGMPDEQGTYQDGRAAYDFLVNTEKVDPSRIVLMGESLGCAVAVQLALDRKAAGLVLEAPFASIVHMAKVVYPFLPLQFVVKTRYDNLEKMPKLALPVLVFHGTADEVIPIAQGKLVADAAPEPKLFVAVSGAHHSDVYEAGGEGYLRALSEFVKRVTMPRDTAVLLEGAKP